MIKGYFLLFTTSSALYAHELLKVLPQTTASLVPTPREFSSDCGIAVYLECFDLEEAKNVLDTHRIEYEFKLIGS